MVGFKDPENAVLVSGDPVVEELICKTITNCTPSVLVTRDTDDDHFKVCGATDDPLGFLDISHKKGIGDTYEADQAARILKGAIVNKAILANGQNVTKGAKLVPAANGRLKAASVLTTDSGATPVTSSAADGAIISGDIGDNIISAIAEASVDASGGEKSIVVKCLL